MNKKFILRILSFLSILFLFAALYKLLIPRSNAFGCFDDCFNFLGGYFMGQGKKLYSEIFFNHQPLFAFISYHAQKISSPINIYDLVLKHRQLLMVFALLTNLLLVWRFGWISVFFAFSYELTKYYFFGDRFLAESFVVYPLVYLLGISLDKQIRRFDVIIASVFCWFIVFSREPYIPVALFTYLIILIKHRLRKNIIISLAIFTLLSFFTLTNIFSSEYLYQLITLNSSTSLSSDLAGKQLFGKGAILIFFYPLYIIFIHAPDLIWQFLTILSLLFVILLIYLLLKRKIQVRWALFVLSILFLANLRYAEPRFVFYGTFHIIPWYGLFLFTVLTLAKKVRVTLIVISIALVLLVTDKKYFAYEKTDPHQVYLTQFGPVQQAGSVFRELKKPKDKLFVDGFDDLVYWEAKMTSDYPYSWFTSNMQFFDKYLKARLAMFKNNPPEFYYGNCPAELNPTRVLPEQIRDNYVNLTSQGKPTCIYVDKRKLPQITENQWQKAKEWLYDKPLGL